MLISCKKRPEYRTRGNNFRCDYLTLTDYGQDLVFISGVMNCCFAYINLMRVRVEVPELFEHPVQFTGAEFFFGRFLLDGPDR
jgi:hypothetical protein